MATTSRRSAAAGARAARKPAPPQPEPASRPPLYVVTPAVGDPWTGVIADVLQSELGSALLCAVRDALRDGGDPNKYTIVSCLRAGRNKGDPKEGTDYLVLSRFVHKI